MCKFKDAKHLLSFDDDQTTVAPRFSRQSCEAIRAVSSSVLRVFSSINLSGFTFLLSGSAPRTINIVSAPTGAVSYNGLTVTSFNTWGTYPLLQLPGLTGATAVTIFVSMVAAYYGLALLSASSSNNSNKSINTQFSSQHFLSILIVGSSLKRRLGKPQFRDTNWVRKSRTASRRSSTSSKEEEKLLLTQVDRKLTDIITEWSKVRNDFGLY